MIHTRERKVGGREQLTESEFLMEFNYNKTPIVGAHWAANCTFPQTTRIHHLCKDTSKTTEKLKFPQINVIFQLTKMYN